MEDIKTLLDALADDDSHIQVVTVFVEMTDSTESKEKNPEATWLSTHASFFDTVTTPMMDAGGEFVKFAGDGVVAVFPDDKAVEAINAAIIINEKIAESIDDGGVEVNCAIGIATGEVIRFATPGETPSVDYIGATVDRAARLCSTASSMAIFVDNTTILAAIGTKITSQIGSASPKRSVEEYIGPAQSIPPMGFISAVSYHEILWSRERFGVKSEIVPDTATPSLMPETTRFDNASNARREEDRPPSQVSRYGTPSRTPETTRYENASNVRRPEDRPPSQGGRESRLTGQVSRWFEENTRGFIKGQDGEDFYTDSRYLASPMSSLTDGAKVFFVPRMAPRPGERRTATCVLELGQTLKGSLVQIHPSNAYGFVEIEDEDGTSQEIYVHLDRTSGDLQVRNIIEFRVSENALGPVGVEAHVIVD